MKGLGALRISEMVLCRYSRICLKTSPNPLGIGRDPGLR
jgi:hypothetical protein